MAISEISDRIMIAKESLKTRFSGRYVHPLADAVIHELGLKNVNKVIHGKPNTIVIVTRDAVIRIPLDKPSKARCRVNKTMLKKLANTGIASFVPRFLGEGRFQGNAYYREERLPGLALDIPLSNMDELVSRAADFITKLHREASREIIIDESNFKRLFGREFKRLYPYLNDEYKAKLAKIEESLKSEFLGKKFKTVWFHGDYKIENVLFNQKTWQINGVIDWDLSRMNGLPLLDLLYLLAYNDSSLISKKSVTDIIRDRFLNKEFNTIEKHIMNRYLDSIGFDNKFAKTMITMFWLNHVAGRCKRQLMLNLSSNVQWMKEHIYDYIDRY